MHILSSIRVQQYIIMTNGIVNMGLWFFAGEEVRRKQPY